MSNITDMPRLLVRAKTRITVLEAQVDDARHETRMARERAEQAEAALATAEAERDAARKEAVEASNWPWEPYTTWNALKADVARLQQEREGLIALAAYAEHTRDCAWRDNLCGSEPCSCGLYELPCLHEIAPPTETQQGDKA